jgi:hypothetical protein
MAFRCARRFTTVAPVGRCFSRSGTARITLPQQSPTAVLSYQHVMDAFKRISGTVKRSPLEHSPRLSMLANCELFLKKEHVSITGSVLTLPCAAGPTPRAP